MSVPRSQVTRRSANASPADKCIITLPLTLADKPTHLKINLLATGPQNATFKTQDSLALKIIIKNLTDIMHYCYTCLERHSGLQSGEETINYERKTATKIANLQTNRRVEL